MEFDLNQVNVQESKLVQESGPNQEVEIQVYIHSPHNGMWLSKIGDSSLRMTGMGIKTDSKMLLKSGSKTGINIDLKFELDHKFEDRSHILV